MKFSSISLSFGFGGFGFLFLFLVTTTAVFAEELMDEDYEYDMYADFLVTTDSTNITNVDQYFVARITSPESIAIARSEIEKEEGWKIISGIISNETAEWNPEWSFHLIPDTVFFGDVFVEVCDANVEYVEENLDDAGGAFLPNYQWCPWSSAVLAELGNSNGSGWDFPTPAPTNAVTQPTPTPAPTPSAAATTTSSMSMTGLVHSTMFVISMMIAGIVPMVVA